MIRRITFVSIPVVLAIVAWLLLSLLLGNGDTGPLPKANPTANSPADNTAGATSAVLSEHASAPPGDGNAVRTGVSIPPTLPPIPDDATWLEVLIVDAASQQPIADAEVQWADNSVAKQVRALPAAEQARLLAEPEFIIRRFGRTTRSNELGIARVADCGLGAIIFAYSEGLFARAYCGGPGKRPATGWRIELDSDRTLRVLVLDSANQPVPSVALRIRAVDATGRDLQTLAAHWTQTTTAAGIVEFPHVQTCLHPNGRRNPALEAATWLIDVDIPGLVRPGTRFNPAQPPLDPLVLGLPAMGRVATRLLHAGQPRLGGVTFSLSRGEPDPNPSWNMVPVPLDDHGWARFPQVSLGGNLNVLARVGSATISRSIVAPTHPGQEVVVELTTEGMYALTGRLLGESGLPLTSAAVTVQYEVDFDSGRETLATDAHGGFVCLITDLARASAQLKRLVITQNSADSPPLRATRPPCKIIPGTNDLGDIQLACGPLVLSGEFALNPPDSEATIHFTIERSNDRRATGDASESSEQWEAAPDLATTYRRDRTFEVHGETAPGRYRLAFYERTHLPIEPIEFAVGTQNLRIPASLGYRLAATAVLPDGIEAQWLQGELLPAGHERAESVNTWRDAAVEMRWPAIPPGTYTLQLRVDGVSSPLATIPEIQIPLPAEGDARLQNIDLRGKIHTLELRVTTNQLREKAQGGPMVFRMPQTNPKVWTGHQAFQGNLVLPVPTGPVDLLIACAGHRPLQVLGATGKVDVTLEPWPTVELTFDNLAQLPENVFLDVSLSAPPTEQYRGVTFQSGFSSGPVFDLLHGAPAKSTVEHGRATVAIGDGTFQLSASIRTKDMQRQRRLRVIPQEIQGGINLAPITVQWSEEELRTALEELRKPPEKK
jgi:hypothetical protein